MKCAYVYVTDMDYGVTWKFGCNLGVYKVKSPS